MKLGMVKLNELIENEFEGEAYILLQIHDEFVFEVKANRAEEFREKACYILRNAASLETTLDVHDSIGVNLSELK